MVAPPCLTARAVVGVTTLPFWGAVNGLECPSLPSWTDVACAVEIAIRSGPGRRQGEPCGVSILPVLAEELVEPAAPPASDRRRLGTQQATGSRDDAEMTATWPAAQRVAAILESMRGFTQTIRHPVLSALADDASACNFLAGNPQQPAPARYVDTLQRWTVPADKNWYGYKRPDRTAQQAAAAGLSAELGIDFEADDIVLTRGAHGAAAAALAAVVDYGDRVIFVSPPWFFYEAMILGAGGTPVRVRMNEETFDLDLDALARALTPRTRAVVINTPHNPTGRVYPPDTLQQLAQLLTSASERHAREIYLEVHRRWRAHSLEGLAAPAIPKPVKAVDSRST